VDVDAVLTNPYAGMETRMIYSGMSKDEYAIMQAMVERGYDLFTKRCADGRGVSQDAIKAVGEGRVWLGKDAVNIGLVDELGNINSAIQKAVELAGVETYQLSYYPEKKDPLKELLKMLDNSTPEERLIMEIHEFASKPRIMTLMPEVIIQ
jgi:protease-4